MAHKTCLFETLSTALEYSALFGELESLPQLPETQPFSPPTHDFVQGLLFSRIAFLLNLGRGRTRDCSASLWGSF